MYRPGECKVLTGHRGMYTGPGLPEGLRTLNLWNDLVRETVRGNLSELWRSHGFGARIKVTSMEPPSLLRTLDAAAAAGDQTCKRHEHPRAS